MKHIEQFNHSLNDSLKPDANDVRTFRSQVDLILQSTIRRLDNAEQACIIGAGKCQDFSLPIFIDGFRRTIATDVDETTLTQSLRRFPTIERKRVEYTGFEATEFFHDFRSRLGPVRSYEKIDQILDQKLAALRDYRFLMEETNRCDLVFVSPIYTQLVYHQILRECSMLREQGYPEHLLKYIESRMLDEMVGIIRRFNQNLIALMKPKGRLIVLSDVFELEHGTEFHLRVHNGIRNKYVMDEIYQGYVDKYGMGLGDYGLYNLDEHLIEEKNRWMMWRVTDKKSYAVKLKVYKHFHIEGGTQ